MAKIHPATPLGGEPDRQITKQPNPADKHYEEKKKEEAGKQPAKRDVAPTKVYPPREGNPQTEHPLPGKRQP